MGDAIATSGDGRSFHIACVSAPQAHDDRGLDAAFAEAARIAEGRGSSSIR
jgi:hypothetical protein